MLQGKIFIDILLERNDQHFPNYNINILVI